MGTTQSIAMGIPTVYKKVADIQDKAALQNNTRVFAESLLSAGNNEMSFDRSSTNAEKIYLYVRDNIKFIDDIENVETLQYPDITIKNGFGDCDDMVILEGALYRSIGYPIALIVIQMTGNDDYNHIYMAVYTNDGWKICDATNKEGIFNWEISPDGYIKRKIIFIGDANNFTGTGFESMINNKTAIEYYKPNQDTFWLWAVVAAAGAFIVSILNIKKDGKKQ